MKTRMLVWRGPSELTGEPIVVLATYDTTGRAHTANVKTGNMIQTWILRDDIAPGDALREGKDIAICGTCPHRSPASGGSGACYVEVHRAPRSVWQAYKAGNYRPYDVEAFRGQKVRFGAYGDPAAVPFEVWEHIADVAAATTGYTHQWKTADPRFAEVTMASADSLEEYRHARAKGYRAFVVRPFGAAKPKGLVQCPASAEAGKKITCADCLQCGGTTSGRSASITIAAHGAGAKKFAAVPN